MKAIRNIIKQIPDRRAALLIGNGPNLAAGIMPSWKDLLMTAAGKPIHFSTSGLLNTEVYDLVELYSDKPEDIKSNICKRLQCLPEQDLSIHRSLMELAEQYALPVLTTNFDNAFEKSIDARIFHLESKSFTRFYPWKTYYADKKLAGPLEGFGIWKIHGDIRYKDSLRLGLTDYMGSVERARALIHKGEGRLHKKKNTGRWSGEDTWLQVWFNMPLIVFGLGCDIDEIFIRWLLIERKRYFRELSKPMNVWFISKDDMPSSVKNLMKNLGVEIVYINDYPEIYSV